MVLGHRSATCIDQKLDPVLASFLRKSLRPQSLRPIYGTAAPTVALACMTVFKSALHSVWLLLTQLLQMGL